MEQSNKEAVLKNQKAVMSVTFQFIVVFHCVLTMVVARFTVMVNLLSDDGLSLNGCQSGGDCSLRDAWHTCKILSSLADGCTVVVPSGAEIVTNSSRGPLLLEASNNITIASSDQPALIRSDQNANDAHHSRLIYFLSNETGVQAAISLERLTVSGYGIYGETDGGAVHTTGNVLLSINNCTFVDNAGGSGGAVYVSSNMAGVQITNSLFQRGLAFYGGALSVSNNVTGVLIENSTFHECEALHEGGAIRIWKRVTDFTLRRSLVEHSSGTSGGGISVVKDVTSVHLERSNFVNCTVENNGGAIFMSENIGDVVLREVSVEQCFADRGGALYAQGGGQGLVVENSRFLFNKAINGSGGSIHMRNNVSDVSLKDVEIGHSYASNTGGGVYLNEVAEVSILRLWAHHCSSDESGGALHVESLNVNVRVHGGVFEYCAADGYGGGGAVHVERYNVGTMISSSVFRHCTTSADGGAVAIGDNNHHLVVDGVTAEHCSANGGGAIFLKRYNDYALITNSQIINCRADWMGGGLLSDYSNLYMRVENTNFTACRAREGGAIAIGHNMINLTLTNSSFQDCSAKKGGAMFIATKSYLTSIIGTRFTNNTALYGGAIFFEPLTKRLVLAGSTFIENSAVYDGGAVFLDGTTDQFLITDSATAQRTTLGETAHPCICNKSESQMVLVNHTDYDATGFLLHFDSLTAIGAESFLWIGINDGTGIVDWEEADSLWPGVLSPPVFVKGPSLRVILSCDWESSRADQDGRLFGVRVFVTPILENPGKPTVFALNAAGGSGGAIASPMDTRFGIINAAQFSFNSAGANGGAIYFGSGNIGAQFKNAVFRENEAEISGGAVVLGAACNSFEFTDCTFELNSAGESGGALAMIYGNGITSFQTDKSNKLVRCAFADNSASTGGAIHLDNANQVRLQDAVMQRNEATSAGGAIYAGSDNLIVLESCLIENCTAGETGGALASVTRNRLRVKDAILQNNSAGQLGGALYTSGGTTLFCSGSLLVANNVAAVAGGGVASVQCPLWDRDDESVVLITGNKAQRGSAMYFRAMSVREDSGSAGGDGDPYYQDGSHSDYDDGVVDDILIADNVATVGGTVYWLFDSDMTSEPEGLKIEWGSNVALYGERVATQAIQVQGPAEYTVEVFGQALDPPLEFGLRDLYGQVMPIQGPTVVAAQLVDTSHQQCGGRTPFLSGTQLQKMVDGTAEFSRLEANCAPKGEIKVGFTAELLDLTEIAEAGRLGDYALTKTVTMSYRSCHRGEYIQDGQCVACPTGTYSLEYPVTQDTTCVDCSGKSGVVTCHGDVIKVSGGYWRRHNTSEAVLRCLGDANGCAGGNGTGDLLCEEGYEGPLCAVCADGYFISNGVCEPCGGDAKVSTTSLVYMAIAGVVGLVTAFMFYAKYLDSGMDENMIHVGAENKGFQQNRWKDWIQQQFQDMQAQLKIVITTYQIVSEVPGNLQVDFPSKLRSFLKVFAVFNLNVMSEVPFGCTMAYNFVDKLVATTLFPIALSLLLALLCAAEVVRLAYICGGHGQDVKALIRGVKDQYLTYFFFLTYLVLPSVSTTIFQTFLCTNVDPRDEDNDKYDSYLIADMSISCTSSYYYRGVTYAVVMLQVYVVGIPLMYFLLLYYNRDAIARRGEAAELPAVTQGADVAEVFAPEPKKRELPSHVKRLSFLWEAYEPKYWYWEVVETARRLMLTAVLSVCGAGTAAQSVFALVLSLLCIKLYGHFKPYAGRNDDVVADVGNFQIFFSFLGALISQNSLLGRRWNDALSVLLIMINTMVTVVFLYFGLLRLRDDWKEREEYFSVRRKKQHQVNAGARVLPVDAGVELMEKEEEEQLCDGNSIQPAEQKKMQRDAAVNEEDLRSEEQGDHVQHPHRQDAYTTAEGEEEGPPFQHVEQQPVAE